MALGEYVDDPTSRMGSSDLREAPLSLGRSGCRDGRGGTQGAENNDSGLVSGTYIDNNLVNHGLLLGFAPAIISGCAPSKFEWLGRAVPFVIGNGFPNHHVSTPTPDSKLAVGRYGTGAMGSPLFRRLRHSHLAV